MLLVPSMGALVTCFVACALTGRHALCTLHIMLHACTSACLYQQPVLFMHRVRNGCNGFLASSEALRTAPTFKVDSTSGR
jgi:hypothetical protein